MKIAYRKGNIEDSFAVFQVFVDSIMDLSERQNVTAITGGRDPELMRSLWQRRQPLFEFLARDAAQFWVAEQERKIVAYARSIEHDGMMDLTEFFVSPKAQSAGVGRELLARTFQSPTARYRVIVATTDERALSRYLKAGVYARFPVKNFLRKAEKVEVKSDLQFDPLQVERDLQELNRIDRALLSHARPAVHRWVATTRAGFIYRRKGEVAGYGYDGGPYALMNDNDFPAVLAHGESRAAQHDEEFNLEVPLINKRAIQYLLERKYQMESFTTFFMSNEAFGKFENYLCFNPIFFM